MRGYWEARQAASCRVAAAMARWEEVMTAIRQREQEGFNTWQIREECSIWTGVNAVVGVGRLGGRCRFTLTN